jgi:hypothetical protein
MCIVTSLKVSAFVLLFSVLALSSSAFAEYGIPGLPNVNKTPGMLNKDITQGNISQNVCDHPLGTRAHDKARPGEKPHWSTKEIRPPRPYTQYLKRKLIEEYGYQDKSMKSYELDHLVPLSSGGHPYDPRNLWPQPWKCACNAKHKDTLEWKMNELICSGEVPLKEAQQMFMTNWIAGYTTFVDPKGCGLEEGDVKE